jgi:hypothetical protein
MVESPNAALETGSPAADAGVAVADAGDADAADAGADEAAPGERAAIDPAGALPAACRAVAGAAPLGVRVVSGVFRRLCHAKAAQPAISTQRHLKGASPNLRRAGLKLKTIDCTGPIKLKGKGRNRTRATNTGSTLCLHGESGAEVGLPLDERSARPSLRSWSTHFGRSSEAENYRRGKP